jgi:hypothetical protein
MKNQRDTQGVTHREDRIDTREGRKFSSVKEAVLFFQDEFPAIPLHRSLSRLVEKKGRGFLTESYIRNDWLSGEHERWPAKTHGLQPTNTPTKSHPWTQN